jgi:hypothetical protein
MKRTPDPVELLRAANPVDPSEVDEADAPGAQTLLASILATPRTPDPVAARKHRRRLLAVALTALITGAAAWIITRPITNPSTIACYQAPSLDSPQVGLVGHGTLDPHVCAPYWTNGLLTNGNYPTGTVPPLIGCVTDTGILAVFPSDNPDLCQDLNLSTPDPESIKNAEPVLELDQALSDYFSTNQCIPITQAVNDIQHILNEHDMSDWTITIGQQQPDRPCASLAFNPEQHTIHIVPIGQP